MISTFVRNINFEKMFWGHTDVVLGPHGVFWLFLAATRFFLCAMRDARAAARPAARRAGTLGCRPTLWLGWWLGFKVFSAAQRRDDAAARL